LAPEKNNPTTTTAKKVLGKNSCVKTFLSRSISSVNKKGKRKPENKMGAIKAHDPPPSPIGSQA
jgi:hypothetical protein